MPTLTLEYRIRKADEELKILKTEEQFSTEWFKAEDRFLSIVRLLPRELRQSYERQYNEIGCDEGY